MKRRNHRHRPWGPLPAILAFGLALAACDNHLNVGPTAPLLPTEPANVGMLKTVEIEGVLTSERGSCLKATILFNGQEIPGARARCQSDQGCGELLLAGVVRAPAGHHSITLQVLRQAETIDDYLASGTVRISRPDIHLLSPVTLELFPTRASLQAGEGVEFEIHLYD